jgi:glycosyltransferase involved in cell wall biosynthesis
MKIAIISDVVYPWVKGGGEKRYYELGRRLVKSGNEVHYFTMHWEGMPDWEFEHEGMKIHCVCEAPLLDKFYVEGRRGIIKSILFSLHLFKKMFGYGRFDVIECNEFPFFHCFTAKLASTLGYGKLFITWHEVWGTYWYDYIGAKGIFGRVIEAITPFLAHRIISVSEFTKKKLVSVLNVPANRIDVVHNGVDVEQIRRINVEKEHNKIVSVGRLIKEKRVDLLLELFSKIVMNNKNAVLSIVGDGPELESLKSISCKLELEHNVIFRGFIPEYDEVIREMKSSMVMVSLSKR